MSAGKDYFRAKKTYAPQPKVIGRQSVIESIGPEGKVRGTAQQLVERYMAGGQEAMRSGDMTLAHACYQYAEHYQRLLQHIKQTEAVSEERRKEKAYKAKPAADNTATDARPNNEEVGIIAPPLPSEPVS